MSIFHRSFRGKRRGLAVVATVMSAGLALSACALDTSSLVHDKPTVGASGIPASLEDFYNQKPQWKKCGEAMCASVAVPLDYNNPTNGKTIELSLKKYESQTSKKIGTLFLNPGGPGGSGLDYVDGAAQTFPEKILDNFDLVGWDPRGVGQSTPVDCLTDKELDEVESAWVDFTTPEGVAESEKQSAEVATKCEEKSGDLLPFVGTESTARDLDVLRGIVGDEELYYNGASYGTFIGAMYAELFPDKVGRLVLDGAVDATVKRADADYQQLMGFEVAARKYVEQCTGKECPLTGTDDEKMRQIQAFLDSLGKEPLKTRDAEGRELTQPLAVYGVILPLYSSQYDMLSKALTDAMVKKDGTYLLAFSDMYLSRENGMYKDNSAEAFWAVNCADYLPMTMKESQDLAARLEKDSLAFGDSFAGSDICAAWPYHPKKNPGPFVAKGSKPILVVGTENDPATPYEWAVSLAEGFDNGYLLTWDDGEGHTAFGRGSECVDDVITDYLVKGELPSGDGKVCK